MGPDADAYSPVLDLAAVRARAWLGTLATRPVPPGADADALLPALRSALGQQPCTPEHAVAELVDLVEPGLMAVPSSRFFGWVMGGTLPAALAADWLVSAWDQNAGLRYATPGVVAAEEAVAGCLLDLLGLPAGAEVGFVTGATMANTTCLAAARHAVLARAGWDVERDGLQGAPRVRVLVGAERHTAIDLSLRYLGLGAGEVVAADAQGRLRADALEQALGAGDGPTIVCLQAGNLHSGAFDPIAAAVSAARRHGAWVHVDGAFGLWAAASQRLRPLVSGLGTADSWATDAHKTLNTPYDCGIAVVADPAALHAAMGISASYLVADAVGDPLDRTPELSRRARGVPLWAALRTLGRDGVAGLVEGFVDAAQQFAHAAAAIEEVEMLNDVVYTQVCVAVGDDERTRAVVRHVLEAGQVWMSGSRWAGRQVMRMSVSNWSTGPADIELAVEALRAAVAATRA